MLWPTPDSTEGRWGAWGEPDRGSAGWSGSGSEGGSALTLVLWEYLAVDIGLVGTECNFLPCP